MQEPQDLQDWAGRFRHFAALDCPQEPLYVALCLAVADCPELLALMHAVPPTQAKVNLLLAALHERVLAGVRHAFAEYFPSMGGGRMPDAQLPALLLDFARLERVAIEAHLRHSKTQTNEIGRCAVLWPALQHMARLRGCESLSLIDFGCSAGLNLGVEHYHYRYHDYPHDRPHQPGADPHPAGVLARDPTFTLGAAAGPGVPEIDCDWLGAAPQPPAHAWRLEQRLGLDLAPVDLHDAQGLRWLRACLWPHDRVRAARFEQAVRLALALTPAQAPELVQSADGLALLEQRLSRDPAWAACAGRQPVLFNSWVLYYFEPQALADYRARVARMVLRHGLVWLSAEPASLASPGLRLPTPAPGLHADISTASATLWTLQWAQGGRLQQQALAWSHPHGRCVQWLA